jgi:hypothetical protein
MAAWLDYDRKLLMDHAMRSCRQAGELRAQSFPQVVPRALGDPAQIAEDAADLGGDRGQLVRPEDDKREHHENQQHGDGQVEHRSLPSPAGGLQRGQLVVG